MFRRATRTVLLLLVAACTPSAITTTTAADATTDSPQQGAEPGRLVVVDDSGNIVVINPDGTNPTMITDDAGETAIYNQPTWSPDGASLAWGQVTPDGFAIGIRAVEDESSTLIPTVQLPFYLYWSPDSQNVGVLRGGSNGVEFEMVDVPGETTSVLDSGSPFYFSWQGDSERVIIHVGPDRFETIEPDGKRDALSTTSSGYLAPQWTPSGIFHVDGGGLVLEDEAGDRREIVEVADFTSFVANREGTHVALQSTGGNPAVSVGLVEAASVPGDRVVVVEVATGQIESVTTDPVLGFFWSPDGESLLMMAPTGRGLRPTVWGVNRGRAEYSEFRPSISLVRDMFPFFPQYAQSLGYWSPDSSAFAYVDDDGVWVQGLETGEPTRVSGGTWVAWSN